VTEFLTRWIGSKGFMPDGNSFQWAPLLLWVYVVSGLLSGLAGYAISLALAYFVRKRRNIQPNWIAVLFLILAFANGTIYLLSIWTIWHPGYWLDATIKLLTGVLSVVTAILLWRLIARSFKNPQQDTEQLHGVIRQLEHEVVERKRAEEALHKSQDLLHQLVAYQERVKEDERKRIAREIHDELGQNLMALRIDVSLLEARTANAHPKLNEKVRFAMRHIDTSIKAVRAIINNLRPSVLDLGLHAAIEWQINEFERRTGIVCKLAMDDSKPVFELDDNGATALFRILQESLSNVARHAQASLVQIELRREDGRLLMKIADNGVGIFPGCRRKPNSFGLLGIEERVSRLGGEFTIDSATGGGTVLTLSIPVEATLAEA
jgi:signal transduction histidine kinase